MGSRILNNLSTRSKIGIACSFMILATAGAWSCPFASGAGFQTYGQYSSDGGIIHTAEYNSIQSTGDIGFCAPGQETLYGTVRDGMISVGRSGFKQNVTIDANDHQVYTGDTYAQYLDGGLTYDSARIEGTRMPIQGDNGVASNVSNTTNTSTNVATSIPLPRPYSESMEVEKTTMGNKGLYIAEKTVEQGSNETTDYITLNAVASGNGMFGNDVLTQSSIGFSGNSNDINYIETSKQHDVISGKYNITSLTTLESFNDVFGINSTVSPSATTAPAQLGLS